MKNPLVILGILVLLFEIYRWLRGNWIRGFLEKKKKGKGPRKPAVMQPKSERDCPFCVEEKGKQASSRREMPVAWIKRKGCGGPKKKISTEGYFCPNEGSEYYGIADERIHALVGDGSHGKQEEIRDLKCQVCDKKFTVRKKVLYRLKTHSGMVEKVLWLLALGVDASALEEVFGVREITIRTWLCRSVKARRNCSTGTTLRSPTAFWRSPASSSPKGWKPSSICAPGWAKPSISPV